MMDKDDSGTLTKEEILNAVKTEDEVQKFLISCGNPNLADLMVPSKLELARKFGATDVINASETDPVGEVREMTGGGVHYSFEAIGLKETAEQAFKILARGGTATVVGMIPVGTTIEIHGPEFLMERKLQGSNMGSNRFRIDMPMYANLYLQGRLKLDELVSRTLTLDEINDGFDALRKGEVARSVVSFA